MFCVGSSKFLTKFSLNNSRTKFVQIRKCRSVFGFKELIEDEKAEKFTVHQSTGNNHKMALEVIKTHYLPAHVLVRAHDIDLDDRALDQYLLGLLKQGNTLYATAEDGSVAGVCVNFASSIVDPKNLRNYAYYRQDQKIKDLLCFTAKLQETPNLWEVFKEPKIFEIKMLTVLPEFRRKGLAGLLAEKSMVQAADQGYKVIRMDCINTYDYKIAERCKFQCVVKFPLHKLRGPNAPFIKRNSEHNRCVRVYVDVRTRTHSTDRQFMKQLQKELESIIE